MKKAILKDTIAISKSVKKTLGLTKLRSQNSEIRFSIVHDVICKYYVIVSVLKKMLISVSQEIMTTMF